MRTILHILASIILTQGPTLPGVGIGPFIVQRPTNFAYVASSVTGCTNGHTGQTTCAFLLHVNPAAGNTIQCGGFWPDTGSVTATISGSRNGSYTAIGSKQAGAGSNLNFSGQMFFKDSASAGTETVTMTITTGVPAGLVMGWECAVYSYTAAPTFPFDGTPLYSNTPASGTTATIGTISTSNTNGIIIAHCLGIQTSCSAGASFTGHNDAADCRYNSTGPSCTTGNYSSDTGSLLEELIGAAIGNKSATFGTGNNDAATLGMVAY